MTVTIFIPTSRKDAVDRNIDYVEGILRSDVYNDLNLKVLFVVDNPAINTEMISRRLYGDNIQVVKTEAKNLNGHSIFQRRERISNVFKVAAESVDKSDMIFCFEDDCVIRPHYLLKLLGDYEYLTESEGINVGMVSGVQVGRWGYRMLGVWKLKGVDTIRTLGMSELRGIMEVDACGFYCMLTPAVVFQTFDFSFSAIGHENFGPDVDFGIRLKAMGFRNFTDSDLHVGHITDHGKILYPDDSVIELEYKREGQKWKRVKP